MSDLIRRVAAQWNKPNGSIANRMGALPVLDPVTRASSAKDAATLNTLRPDIQAAKDRMRSRFGGRREFNVLESHMWSGETVISACVGTYGPGMGLLVVTSHRLLFIMHGLGRSFTEDFPFDKVSSVQWNNGLMQGTLTIYASNNKAEIKAVLKDDGKAIADRIRATISGATDARATATSTPPSHSPVPPAGWYVNPENQAQLRWWNGQQWTEHYR